MLASAHICKNTAIDLRESRPRPELKRKQSYWLQEAFWQLSAKKREKALERARRLVKIRKPSYISCHFALQSPSCDWQLLLRHPNLKISSRPARLDFIPRQGAQLGKSMGSPWISGSAFNAWQRLVRNERNSLVREGPPATPDSPERTLA